MALVRLPRRLRAVLGADIQYLDENALQQLIGVREDTDLDVKGELYGNADRDRRELAADVSSMANAIGGLIVLGAHETNEVIELEMTEEE